jgi:hypothetical protein
VAAGEESAAEQRAFDRGHVAGEIARTLSDHAAHLAAINGSTERTAETLTKMAEIQAKQALSLQALADQVKADARTREATATALKEADTFRRQTEDEARNLSEQSWIPWARMIAVVGALAAAAGLLAFLVGRHGG